MTAGEFPQNYYKTVAFFSPRKIGRQTTTIYHAIHHNSPRKHHAKTPIFPAPPSKNAHKTAKNTLSHRPQIFLK
jgi:hypothetical protein